MRRILLVAFTVLLIGAVAWGIFKAVPTLNKKSSSAPSASVEPSVQIEGTNLYLAENGQVTDRSVSKKPLLYIDKKIKAAPNTVVTDPQILFAAKVASGLAKSDFSVASVRLLPSGDIAVYNPAGAIAVFSGAKDAKSQIDSLQQVLAKAKIDAAKITKIDLRFDQPVITFK